MTDVGIRQKDRQFNVLSGISQDTFHHSRQYDMVAHTATVHLLVVLGHIDADRCLNPSDVSQRAFQCAISRGRCTEDDATHSPPESGSSLQRQEPAAGESNDAKTIRIDGRFSTKGFESFEHRFQLAVQRHAVRTSLRPGDITDFGKATTDAFEVAADGVSQSAVVVQDASERPRAARATTIRPIGQRLDGGRADACEDATGFEALASVPDPTNRTRHTLAQCLAHRTPSAPGSPAGFVMESDPRNDGPAILTWDFPFFAVGSAPLYTDTLDTNADACPTTGWQGAMRGVTAHAGARRPTRGQVARERRSSGVG